MTTKKKSNGVFDAVRDTIAHKLAAYRRGIFRNPDSDDDIQSKRQDDLQSKRQVAPPSKSPEQKSYINTTKANSSPSVRSRSVKKQIPRHKKSSTNSLMRPPKTELAQTSSAETIRLPLVTGKPSNTKSVAVRKKMSNPSKSPECKSRALKSLSKSEESPSKVLKKKPKKDQHIDKRKLLAQLTNELIRLQSCDEIQEAENLCTKAVKDSKRFDKLFKDTKQVVRAKFRELVVECEQQKEIVLQELNNLSWLIDMEMKAQGEQEKQLDALIKRLELIEEHSNEAEEVVEKPPNSSPPVLLFILLVAGAVWLFFHRKRQ